MYFKHTTNAFDHHYIFLLILAKGKFLGWPRLKAFADSKINVTEKLKFILGKVETIAGIGENAAYLHFSPLPSMFQKASFSGLFKSRDYVGNCQLSIFTENQHLKRMLVVKGCTCFLIGHVFVIKQMT